MADIFDETLQSSADSFFLLTGTELITYVPKSGPSRQIKAVVYRPGPEQMDDVAGGSRPHHEVLVKNNAAGGIASSEVDTGGDKLELGLRVNNRPVVIRITGIINQDAGMMLLKAW